MWCCACSQVSLRQRNADRKKKKRMKEGEEEREKECAASLRFVGVYIFSFPGSPSRPSDPLFFTIDEL